jgi:hypothetical protein
MGVQRKTDLSNKPFILSLLSFSKDAETVAQDAGRGADMLVNTLMAYNPTTAKWEPFTDETATDGTQYPRGILLRTLAQADIVAGDVEDVPILVGEAICDLAQLVIENSKTLATVINIPAGFNTSVEDYLRLLNIYMESVIDTTAAA